MAEEQVVEKKKDEDWMQKKWRPAMGWMYMVVCFFDMVIFPILWALIQSIQHQQLVQWNPLTLQGAGLFHVAMGAVLGIAAFGRTQEKIAGSANNAPTPTAPTATPFPAPVPAAPSVPTPTFPTAVAAPAPAPVAGFGAGFPGDPPTRNTRNDG
jgi:hypothetical protein